MPAVKPFAECIARPTDDGKRYPLTSHLSGAAKTGLTWLEKEDKASQTLFQMAVLCHDAFKAQPEWQSYINRKTPGGEGPVHAPPGAYLFSYIGYHYLKQEKQWGRLCREWIRWIRDIADHHGTLKNLDILEEGRWIKRFKEETLDFSGLEKFFHHQIPTLKNIPINVSQLDIWRKKVRNHVEEVLENMDIGRSDWSSLQAMRELQHWRQKTMALIAGDRLEIQPVNSHWLGEKEHQRHVKEMESFCQKASHHPLAALRQKATESIMEQLEASQEQSMFTLEMPTGYGKTLTALRMASWLGENQGYKKIVYVAPYLSILEQTAKVIQDAMKADVLEHHSLAIMDETSQEESGSVNGTYRNQRLATETWAHSIVCTTFQQFFRGMLPRKAQDVLRRAFLQDTVIIIDEPQIFNTDLWNVFLISLEAVSSMINGKIIFLSATMPAFHYGLTQEPKKLSFKTKEQPDRFTLRILRNPMREEELVEHCLEGNQKTQCLIVNTIRDAYYLYEILQEKNQEKNEEESSELYLVHGLMTPLHKKMIIEKIRKRLKAKSVSRMIVVSTQVLEAGVDVSFQRVIRAKTIMPSIVQAAGRVNRHNEMGKDKQGSLEVVTLLRNGEKDTSTAIYPRSLLRITDALLEEKDGWRESEVDNLIKSYYDEMFRENTYEQSLQYIRDAVEGRWEKLGSLEVFSQHYHTLSIFVPWDPEEEDRQYLPPAFIQLQQRFGINSAEEVYAHYSDWNFIKKKSYEDRKAFMVLFHYYVISVSMKDALKHVPREDFLQGKTPMLFSEDSYHPHTGLTSHFEEDHNKFL
ncbi:CRISPR-associated helicase Cas3 [Tindallia magadiensis]|uniref:CRISPR-associated helicase Cas3 n=1 Tax=Tindallia magadiensis TaxID=69895 RepID=A0A1I3EPB5_9FIRM|nr:CRISPR-associated helicase Cas3' [Tindallia magadiensis]SFI00670.1 CRISPR-associated helicase Cas3 [Tindallia magadiensis]